MTAYLVENKNPYAVMDIRSGGPIFQAHGHRERKGGAKSIRLVVLHTAEALDGKLADGDSTAESVAKYLSTTARRASAHVVVDSDSEIVLLPDEAVAFHCRGVNSISLGLEIAYRAASWGSDPKREDALISRAAAVLVRWGSTHRIPVRRLSLAEVDRGHRGIAAHADLDPKRRTDPGSTFPWGKLFARIFEIAKALGEPLGEDPSHISPPSGIGTRKPVEGLPEVLTAKMKIEALQAALAVLGVYSGDIDGIAGSATRAALAAAMIAASRRDLFLKGSWLGLQLALDNLGAEAGPADDLPGPRTTSAIRRVLRSLFPE